MNNKKEQTTSHKDLCNLLGVPENTSSQELVSQFIFGDDKGPQVEYVWPGGTKK